MSSNSEQSFIFVNSEGPDFLADYKMSRQIHSHAISTTFALGRHEAEKRGQNFRTRTIRYQKDVNRSHHITSVQTFRELRFRMPTGPWLDALTAAEKALLEMYTVEIAPAVDAAMDSSLWKSRVLRAAVRNPALLYAVLSFSCAYQAHSDAGSHAADIWKSKAYALSLTLSDQALRHLQCFIRTSDCNGCMEDDDFEAVLLSALMLIPFHLLQGERGLATSSFAAMIKLLNDRQRSGKYVLTVALFEITEVCDWMASGTLYFRLQPLPRWKPQGYRPRIPLTFCSFDEARRHLDILSTAGYRMRDEICRQAITISPHQQAFEGVRGTASQNIFELCAALTMEMERSCSFLLADMRDLRTALDQWIVTYCRFSSGRPSTQETMRLTIKQLSLKHVLLTCFTSKAEVYDSLSADCRTILDIATEYIALGPAALSGVEPAKVAGPEITTPVYRAGLFCRDPRLRRRALQMLDFLHETDGSQPRIDLHGLALRSVIEAEENLLSATNEPGPRLKNVVRADDFARENRILDVQIVQTPAQKSSALLLCARLDDQGRVRISKSTII